MFKLPFKPPFKGICHTLSLSQRSVYIMPVCDVSKGMFIKIQKLKGFSIIQFEPILLDVGEQQPFKLNQGSSLAQKLALVLIP